MATTRNLPPGAVAPNGSADLFTSSPSHSHPAPLRYAAFDNDHFSLYSTNSPSAARRALEAHLKDTDRRIQDASRLGSTLVQQRKDLASKLKEVEQMQQQSEMPAELREKLAELEREYNEVGRESARAFLPKSRVVSDTGPEPSAVIAGSGWESPTKVSAPSRRQRNQPNNRVHDIEFATEISTSLLAQVRQLQAALAEKDGELKDTTAARAQLESEAESLVQRLRHMDENEQKYKDENWNLETRLQEMESTLKHSTDKESRIAQALKAMQTEKAAKERELDDLKVTHDKLSEDHAMSKKVQEADLHGLRRDAASHESEKFKLQKRVEELVAQNTELAKAVSYRFSQGPPQSDTDFVSAEEGVHSDDQSPLHSEPNSPIKGTPARLGGLETETLKSSLNHAHRMIQNLKNTIHREKTEKIELKRVLQDARDELESRRENSGVTANSAKKRRGEPESSKFKRPSHMSKLGATRGSTTEIIDEPDWEDQDSEQSPTRKFHDASSVVGSTGAGFGRSEGETTDAFETANERDTTTESEAFATGNEDFDDDTEGDATETEGGPNRSARAINSLSNNPRDRRSFMSTASTSGDEDDEIIKTPVHSAQPKYKLRLNRGVRRSGRASELVSASPSFESNNSPASSTGTPQPVQMQSLGDELDALDDDSVEGTPASSRMISDHLSQGTPATQRHASADPESPLDLSSQANMHEPLISTPDSSQRNIARELLSSGQLSQASVLAPSPVIQRAPMVDAGVMTEHWEPERIVEERIVEKIVEVEVEPKRAGYLQGASAVAGAALTGLGLGNALSRDRQTSHDSEALGRSATEASELAGSNENDANAETANDKTGATADANARSPTTRSEPQQLQHSPILSQATEPIPLPVRTFVEKGQDAWALDHSEPASSNENPTHESKAYSSVRAQVEPANFSFSPVVAQEFEPAVPEPEVISESEHGSKNLVYIDQSDRSREGKSGVSELPGSQGSMVGAGFFAAASAGSLDARKGDRTSLNQGLEDASTDSKFLEDRSIGLATSDIGKAEDDAFVQSHQAPSRAPPAPPSSRTALKDVAPNVAQGKYVAHEGSQTLVSGQDIDRMLRDKRNILSSNDMEKESGMSTIRGSVIGGARSSSTPHPSAIFAGSKENNEKPDGHATIYESSTSRARPSSAGSVRSSRLDGAPPLPPDHTAKIAAAQYAPGSSSGQSMVGVMGPPLVPASAYRPRPRTPNERPTHERRTSREGTTPRTVRLKDSKTHMQSDRISHRTSVSSFASELDERFNISRGQIMYPHDVEPATDPRMIQAITQTMIGEYLWKYTRKAGRSETSSSRHRRFFWVHPYTRTLYWSEQDPSTAGKNMLKAKSVAIEAVRVISDDNAYPPGLHRKSLVVITPGREIVFTAPTGQRHETWFNALSYLLLRTEREKSEAEDTFDQSDIDEFNPGQRGSRKTTGKFTGRSRSRQSRASLSSYNSHTTRTTSPQRQEQERTAAQRQGTGTITQRSMQQPTVNGGHNATGTSSSRHQSGSVAGRFSSIASRFRPTSGQRARSSASSRQPEDPAQIYDASVVADSAEDLRAVIERQERDADRLENVRACCDGKHDVGSLSRNQRHSSFGNRFGSHGHHSHSHPHRT